MVDDGSTDETESLLTEFCQNISSIRFLIRPENQPKGANCCRNIGIDHAKGDYVAFLDSDDEWRPDKLQNDYDFINKFQPDATFSGAIIDDGTKQINAPSRGLSEEETPVDYIFSDDVMAATSSFVVKSDLAKDIRFDESLQRHQDMDFFIRFGSQYKWTFRDDFDTILHWLKSQKRGHHFESMIQFYQTYKREVSSKKSLGRYLIWSWVNARRYDRKYTTFYLNELKEIRSGLNLKQRVFSYFPELSYRGWSLLKKIKS